MLQTESGVIVIVVVFVLGCALFLAIGLAVGAWIGRRREAARLPGVVKARLRQSRAVLGGLVSEQLAPFLPGFPFDPGDCRFVGKPVDFVVFRGMNSGGIEEVIFLEVKSGSTRRLSEPEKRLKEAVLNGRVKWAEFPLAWGRMEREL